MDPFTIAAERTAAYVQEMVQGQIKVSAYKTGNLMDSVRATYEREGDVFTFTLDDPTEYGDFTDFGTRPYRATERGPFTSDPEKGEGGIVPRFWSSLDDSKWARAEMFFEEALEQAQAQLDL